MKHFRALLPLSVLLGIISVRAHSAPSLEFVDLTVDGEILLRINGTDGREYRLEMSTNLATWSSVLQLRTTNQTELVQIGALPGMPAVFFRGREALTLSNLTLVPQASTNFTASTLVKPDGGRAELTTETGTRIVLTINPGLLADAEVISMTLLTNLGGLPFAAGTFGAVRIEPEEARFSGSLEIFYPTGLDRRQVASFRADGDGSNFRLAFDRARSNRVVIPLFQSGIYGSSVASLAEVAAAAGYAPVVEDALRAQSSDAQADDAGMSAFQRQQACWGDSFESEEFLQSTKDCFEDRMVRAMVIRCQIEADLEEAQRPLIRELVNDRQRQLTGQLDDDTPTSLQRALDQICPFYQNHVAPHWARAKDDCAMAIVLVKFAFSFQDQLESLGLTGLACVPSLQQMGSMACAGVKPCLKEIQECCERGFRGRGRFGEVLALYRQFVLFGTDCFNPYGAETKPVRDACYTNAWMGTFFISEKWSTGTNIVGPGNAWYTATNTYEYVFSGTVHTSEEQIFGGLTNISLNVTGEAAAEFHAKYESWQGIDCRDPDEDVEHRDLTVQENIVRTNGTYFVGISIGANGEYTLQASTFTMLDGREREHTYRHHAFCNGRVESTNIVTVKPQPYLGSSLFFPITRTMTRPDRISGRAEIPIPSSDGPQTVTVEWILARNEDVPQGP